MREPLLFNTLWYDILMKTKLLVKFTYALMHNEETKYCVYQYKNLSGSGKVTCVGYDLPTVSIPYEFEVEEIEHKKYGKQYKVTGYEEKVGSDKESVVEYLGCGLFRGIGKTTAQRIYDHFKEDTLQIFLNDVDRLIEVKGISRKTLQKIRESQQENRISRDLQQYLIPFGISVKLIVHICNAIPENTLETIKNNPYVLCKVHGISFKIADAVAHSQDIKKDDPRRIEAAIKEALKMNNLTGSVGCPAAILLQYCKKISGIYDERFLWNHVMMAVSSRRISYVKKQIDDHVVLYFYLNHIYSAETALAEQVVKHATTPCRQYKDINSIILKCCEEEHIVLDESQFAAVRNSFLYNFLIITGGPGTGKTTISNIILKVQEKLKKRSAIELVSPTGRAARKMSECMGRPASTIHSRLQLGVHGEGIDRMYQEDVEPIDCDLLICDEFSMVDMMLALKLFSSIERGRIILVGDKDQLSSVGAGNVLKDIIDSGVVPVSVLEYEHRQDDDSVICENAHNMQKGITSLKDGSDFHSNYDPDMTGEGLLKTIEDKMVDQYLKDYQDPAIKSIICLSPYKENSAGVYALNRRLQNAINPLNGRTEVPIPNGMTLREGDPVMHLQNNDLICNGDIGYVTKIVMENNSPVITVDYSSSGSIKDYEYTKDTLSMNTVTLAYSMTVHKAQGGEYDSVIFCMTKQHKMLLKRNILYTAITRGKKKVTNFFDSPQTVAEAINNNQAEERYTMLCFRIKERAKNIVAAPKSSGREYEQMSLFSA